jgi:16S rRNA (cytidine1402-2'-O)-methyltransferase
VNLPPALGTLLLVPNTLDLGSEAVDIRELLPLGVLRRAAGLAHWVAEDARSARAFLKRVHAVMPLCAPLQQIDIRELYTEGQRVSASTGDAVS